jgi:3-hydroxyisobutyrate dehydrogenase-like beta-hydroxyacid dehydrogenase
MSTDLPRLALIGFGEAASTFARAGNWGAAACAWDILPERRAAMAEYGVIAASSAEEALSGAGIVLALVTADTALEAARDYAPFLRPGTLWCDMNSVAPDTKRAASEAVGAAGADYIDMAVMAPVNPQRLAVPVLISGPSATEAMDALGGLGFSNLRIVGDEIGRASAIKMIRSVMVKGIEALSFECAEAASAAGVLDEVLASLDASERLGSWADKFAYNRERMELHGVRRAKEMEESAKTLADLGVEPVMTRSTAEVQRRAAGKGAKKDKAA